jgi:hypothetical protein
MFTASPSTPAMYLSRRLLLGIALSLSFFLCNLQRACVSMSVLLFSEPNAWTESDKGISLHNNIIG